MFMNKKKNNFFYLVNSSIYLKMEKHGMECIYEEKYKLKNVKFLFITHFIMKKNHINQPIQHSRKTSFNDWISLRKISFPNFLFFFLKSKNVQLIIKFSKFSKQFLSILCGKQFSFFFSFSFLLFLLTFMYILPSRTKTWKFDRYKNWRVNFLTCAQFLCWWLSILYKSVILYLHFYKMMWTVFFYINRKAYRIHQMCYPLLV